MDLRGAVAVVTGASSGIGESTALLLARAGASLVLAARRLERLEALAERIGAHGGQALPVRCDVARPADLAELVQRTDEAYGRCDVLVNNAGIPGGGPFRSLSPERIERVVRVNLLGVMLGTRVPADDAAAAPRPRRGCRLPGRAVRDAHRRSMAHRSMPSSRSARPCTTS